MPRSADEIQAALLNLPLVAGLERGKLRSILSRCEMADLPAESTAWKEGDETCFFAAIQSGIVAMSQCSAQGQSVVVELLGAGDSTGLLATLSSVPHPFTATVVCDCRILKIPSEPWRALTREQPGILARTVEDVVPRMLGGFSFLATMSHAEVETRIAVALLRLAELAARESDQGVIPLTRRVLAAIVGTTVESAIRVTSKWHKVGWLAGQHGRIEILDFDAVRNIASHRSCSIKSASSA